MNVQERPEQVNVKAAVGGWVTVAPLIGLPPSSFTVTVIVALRFPPRATRNALSVDCEGDTEGTDPGAA